MSTPATGTARLLRTALAGPSAVGLPRLLLVLQLVLRRSRPTLSALRWDLVGNDAGLDNNRSPRATHSVLPSSLHRARCLGHSNHNSRFSSQFSSRRSSCIASKPLARVLPVAVATSIDPIVQLVAVRSGVRGGGLGAGWE